MCTVSFVPTSDGCIITSNRDEHFMRKPALPPESYRLGNVWITFPKDTQAGGTWFVVRNDLSSVMVLLNGAFQKHDFAPPYRRSRGLILLNLISHSHTNDNWHSIDLLDVEPFTIIYSSDQNLEQWVWDGNQKYGIELDKKIPHIWSSSTLYEESIRNERKIWFDEFLENTEVSPENLFNFHKFTNTHDTENGLIIQRSNGVRTQSITQVYRTHADWKMIYENLAESSIHHVVPK